MGLQVSTTRSAWIVLWWWVFDDSLLTVALLSSVYWYGKSLERLARFMLIADKFGDTTKRDVLAGRLATYLNGLFDPTNTHWLGYEPYWGGVTLVDTL